MGYEELKGVAELAKEKDLYFVVEVTIPGQDETEFIANKQAGRNKPKLTPANQ